MLKTHRLIAVAAIAATPVVVVASASGADPYAPTTPTSTTPTSTTPTTPTTPVKTPTPAPTPAPTPTPGPSAISLLASTEAGITSSSENLSYTLLLGSKKKHAQVQIPAKLSGRYTVTYSAKVPVSSTTTRKGKKKVTHTVYQYAPVAVGTYYGRPQAQVLIALIRNDAGRKLYEKLVAEKAESLHVQATATVVAGGKTATTGYPLTDDLPAN